MARIIEGCGRMRSHVPQKRFAEGSKQAADRQRVGRLLQRAFPLTESGSFAGLLEAISNQTEQTRSG